MKLYWKKFSHFINTHRSKFTKKFYRPNFSSFSFDSSFHQKYGNLYSPSFQSASIILFSFPRRNTLIARQPCIQVFLNTPLKRNIYRKIGKKGKIFVLDVQLYTKKAAKKITRLKFFTDVYFRMKIHFFHSQLDSL